ncbi:hypothetical protein [Helicobacter sp. MIT 01-3238]|uniref:hypothetical protein n=1 Tax=Helicobacter sp. MIT 01-3238 TaxID=398627 RepID=UPI0015F14368|nr:hypothetical protein [Helicobacter sp. MIT 01-3238]
MSLLANEVSVVIHKKDIDYHENPCGHSRNDGGFVGYCDFANAKDTYPPSPSC